MYCEQQDWIYSIMTEDDIRKGYSLKGTTFSNPLERGQYDSEGKACITMQGFIYMLHIALVDLIANSYDSRRGAAPRELRERGMKENPQLKFRTIQLMLFVPYIICIWLMNAQDVTVRYLR